MITKAGRNGGTLHISEKGDPSPNPAGLPKGTLHTKTIIKRWLEAQEKAKNVVTGQEEDLSQFDRIVLAQIKKAINGDTAAFNALLDRTEGKATQPVSGDSDRLPLFPNIIIKMPEGLNIHLPSNIDGEDTRL